MNKKIIIGTTLMLIITFAVFANTAVGVRFSRIERRASHEELTEITTFDEGVVIGWRYFSLPFDAEISTDDIRVSHNGALMNLNQAENQNILYDSIMVYNPVNQCWDFTTDLEPGKAYIVYVLTSDDITLSAVGAYTDGSGPITLQRGWNYFGLPTTEQIPISTLRFSCEEKGIENLGIHGAHGILVNKYNFWHLTNTNNPYYESIDLDNDVIVPGDVYCIYCYRDGVEVSFAPVFK